MNIHDFVNYRDEDKQYADFLRGKKVVFVGPAPYITNLNQCDLIESYDVVVRVNAALPHAEELHESCGKRTDVLYHCFDQSRLGGRPILWQHMKDIEVKWLSGSVVKGVRDSMNKSIDVVHTQNEKWNFPLHMPNQQMWLNLYEHIKTRPNAGFAAVYDLLNFDIDELYITGMSFYRGGFVKQYKDWSEDYIFNLMKKSGNHKQEPQRKFLKELRQYDSRIKTDKYLGAILDEENGEFDE